MILSFKFSIFRNPEKGVERQLPDHSGRFICSGIPKRELKEDIDRQGGDLEPLQNPEKGVESS